MENLQIMNMVLEAIKKLAVIYIGINKGANSELKFFKPAITNFARLLIQKACDMSATNIPSFEKMMELVFHIAKEASKNVSKKDGQEYYSLFYRAFGPEMLMAAFAQRKGIMNNTRIPVSIIGGKCVKTGDKLKFVDGRADIDFGVIAIVDEKLDGEFSIVCEDGIAYVDVNPKEVARKAVKSTGECVVQLLSNEWLHRVESFDGTSQVYALDLEAEKSNIDNYIDNKDRFRFFISACNKFGNYVYAVDKETYKVTIIARYYLVGDQLQLSDDLMSIKSMPGVMAATIGFKEIDLSRCMTIRESNYIFGALSFKIIGDGEVDVWRYIMSRGVNMPKGYTIEPDGSNIWF